MILECEGSQERLKRFDFPNIEKVKGEVGYNSFSQQQESSDGFLREYSDTAGNCKLLQVTVLLSEWSQSLSEQSSTSSHTVIGATGHAEKKIQRNFNLQICQKLNRLRKQFPQYFLLYYLPICYLMRFYAMPHQNGPWTISHFWSGISLSKTHLLKGYMKSYQ